MISEREVFNSHERSLLLFPSKKDEDSIINTTEPTIKAPSSFSTTYDSDNYSESNSVGYRCQGLYYDTTSLKMIRQIVTYNSNTNLQKIFLRTILTLLLSFSILFSCYYYFNCQSVFNPLSKIIGSNERNNTLFSKINTSYYKYDDTSSKMTSSTTTTTKISSDTNQSSSSCNNTRKNFPCNFLWGVATSSYQIEGGIINRGLNIWDIFVQKSNTIVDHTSGQITDDHYHLWKQDIALMKSLNIKAYRFSIAWTRILPKGIIISDNNNESNDPITSTINVDGINFYNQIINELLKNDIIPFLTLFHWDSPQYLHDIYCDWLRSSRTYNDNNQCNIIDAFGNYSRIIYQLFGDRVKHFITINEPWTFAVNGYSSGIHAPGRYQNASYEPYLVGHMLLLAHARAYRVYHTEFVKKQNGMVGVANSGDYRYPKDASNLSDHDAAERAMVFQWGWFMDPILIGDYPLIMKERLGKRLPEFTDSERTEIYGSTDFIGLNYYSSLLASHPSHEESYGGYWSDIFVNFSNDPSWEQNDMGWNIVPDGLRRMLNWISNRYDDHPIIYITENGSAEHEEDIGMTIQYDTKRQSYIEKHVIAISQAIQYDHINVGGYFVWSLLDNFEWQFGYQKRFGICFVNFTTLTRTPKWSALWYNKNIQNNGDNLIIIP